jgi:hypothetical protein
MNPKAKIVLPTALLLSALFVSFTIQPAVHAHCDTLDGPVIISAKTALERGTVFPVLKWVKKEYEEEIISAFGQTLAVRKLGPEAKRLADTYFFETLVRLHRAGEGAPYDGLKPAGTDLGPAVKGADEALQKGTVEPLVKLITEEVASGIRKRYREALERKKHAEDSPQAGRAFVEAYVEFVHYVERLDLDVRGHAGHHGATERTHMKQSQDH